MRASLFLLLAAALFVSAVSAQCDARFDLSTQGWNNGGVMTNTNTGITNVSVATVKATPDSSRAIYLTDAIQGTNELWSVPTTGGTPTRISRGLVTGGNVLDFQIVTNARVVYRANARDTTNIELWSVPVAGGGSTRLNPTVIPAMPPNSPAEMNRMTEADYRLNNGRVFFRGSFNNAVGKTQMELYSAPIAGPAGVRLSTDTMDTTKNVSSFKVSSASVIFSADLDVDGEINLYSTGRESDLTKRLSIPKTGTSIDVGGLTDYRYAADITKVYYVAPQNAGAAITGKELYIATVGTAASGTLLGAANPDTRALVRYQVTPTRVVYQASFQPGAANVGNSLLYSTGLAAADVKDLVVPPTVAASVQADWVATGSTNVHFRGGFEAATRIGLYQVSAVTGIPAMATANNRISQMSTTGDVTDFKVGASRVVYRGMLTPNAGQELFSTDLTTEAVTTLNPQANPVRAVTVDPNYLHQDNLYVIFTGKLNPDATVMNREIYSNAVTTAGTPATAKRLAAPEDGKNTGRDVQPTGGNDVQYSPNNARVVFKASLSFDATMELYSVQPDNLMADRALKVNDPLNQGRNTGQWIITTDSTLVVFMSEPTGIMAIYTEPLIPIATQNNKKISKTPLVSPGAVVGFQAFDGSARLFYNGKINNELVPDLFDCCTGASSVATTVVAGGTTPTPAPTTPTTTAGNATTATPVGQTTTAAGGATTTSSSVTMSASFAFIVLALVCAALF